ncbi:MAG: hypothetical protein P8Z71_11080 [Candidatus Sulfobium sp.]
MKAEEIFETSVKVMRELVTSEGMKAAIGRVAARAPEENVDLLDRERERVNELVRKIAEADTPCDVLKGVPQDLLDAMVLRYFRNRDVFMKTFPEGIESLDVGPVLVWAAMMISPRDDEPPQNTA